MASLKGGRGQKAPWEAAMVRCPEPIKTEVQEYIDDWKGSQVDLREQRLMIIDIEDVRSTVRSILRKKKSAKVSLEMLLQDLGIED